jgi:hypothetical protein
LDDGNLRNLQDITKPQLFPDYEWHSSGKQGHMLPGDPVIQPLSVESAGISALSANSDNDVKPLTAVAKTKRSASTIYLINKSREVHHRFQNSAFYVHPTQEADVIRHGKERQQQQQRADLLILKQMGKTADPHCIPPELLRDDDLGNIYGHDGGAFKKRSLDDLAAEERADRRKRKENEDEGQFSDAPDAIEEEEEEEDVDYGTNHYESEGDESAGGGASDEAIF